MTEPLAHCTCGHRHVEHTPRPDGKPLIDETAPLRDACFHRLDRLAEDQSIDRPGWDGEKWCPCTAFTPAPVPLPAGSMPDPLDAVARSVAIDAEGQPVKIVYLDDAKRIRDAAQIDAYASGRKDQAEEDGAELRDALAENLEVFAEGSA